MLELKNQVLALWADPGRLLLNLLDILIIAYVFYRVFMWIRGTRAIQLLKGLLFLLAFSAAASWLHLTAVSWLLEKVWTGIFVALPVVFQPELRRALEQLGRGRLLPGVAGENRNGRTAVIEEVVQAAVAMAEARTGALIAWARNSDLEDFAASGVRLDARVSRELLINLFVPRAPLHDGAVIISQDRLQAAGAVLPLSDSPEIAKELGTRHRAALGLSEVSDAVVVVVSEETGVISVAEGGRLQRGLSENELRAVLEDSLGEGAASKARRWWKTGEAKKFGKGRREDRV